MTKLSLIPEPKREQGERGEELRISYLERGCALCLDLEEALSDGNNNLLAWLNRLEEAEQTPTIDELREIIGKIYGQVTKIHVQLSNARQPPSQ